MPNLPNLPTSPSPVAAVAFSSPSPAPSVSEPRPLEEPAAQESAESSDRPGAGTDSASQRREHLRFDKVFTVRVESILFGDMVCVARNVSAGGIFLELADPLPLGATLRVCFPVPDGSGEVVAVGEVKNHYFINYAHKGVNKAVAGMAVRFTSFESDSHRILEDCLTRLRV
ncbi:MAG: PilZ domain-containing protein, partial [Myxococcales bacterium]